MKVKSWLLRLLAPGYGRCLRCEIPWLFTKEHATPYGSGRGCFPLCERCWHLLASFEARYPYYRRLVFEVWWQPSVWPEVLAGLRHDCGMVWPSAEEEIPLHYRSKT